MAHGFKADNLNADGNMSDSSFGRGRLFSDRTFTPVAGRGNVEQISPELCSTRVTEQTPSHLRGKPLSVCPDINDPAWYNLITHIAQEV